jgi:hypothetical protein
MKVIHRLIYKVTANFKANYSDNMWKIKYGLQGLRSDMCQGKFKLNIHEGPDL